MQPSDTEIRPSTGRLRYKLLCGGLVLVNVLLMGVIYLLTTNGQTIYDWLPNRQQQQNKAQAATVRTEDEMFFEQLYTTLRTADDRLLVDKAWEWYAEYDREYGAMDGSADYINYDYMQPKPKSYHYT